MESFPDEIGKCGVNCSLASCIQKGRCNGCGSEDHNQKRISKWKCKIRVCVTSRNLFHCGECQEFPCRMRAYLDNRYLKKYGIDLQENIRMLTSLGPERWLSLQKERYTCPGCGDQINPYSEKCSQCGEGISSVEKKNL